MKEMLALVLVRAIELAITGGVQVAMKFLNRNVTVIQGAEAEGRDLTPLEQKAITDDIRDTGNRLLSIDTGD